MSLSHFKPPFRACPHGRIIDSQETPLCKEIEVIEASEICAILNAHFEKKEEQEFIGICGKCLKTHIASHIGYKCAFQKCDGIVTAMVNAEEPKPEPPQPNREETDRVAAEYYKSGRTLEVQANVQGTWSDQTSPSFSYTFPWRIKPKKRRVVVEIYNCGGLIVSHVQGSQRAVPENVTKFLGTIEGEVEA